MMTPDLNVRVSIFERLVPSLAITIVAISGAVGGLMVIRFLRALRHEENAGYSAFFGGVAEIEFVVGVVLVFAGVLCAIGLIVSVIRLFTTNATASPPGILFLMTGLLSIVPTLALHYVLRLMKGVLMSPDPTDGGISAVADTVINVSYFAIGSAVLIALVILAFAFIPFSSSPGRKASPLVCLMLIQILVAVLIGVYFWGARTSIAERDKDRTESSESSFEPPDVEPAADDDVDSIANEELKTYNGDANRISNSRVISGGVLNSKAINLRQPAYPAAARAVRATGAVTVQITVNEKGAVILANAVSGHPLLRPAAVQAARHARFAPTKLSGQPVKVTGVLTFNFTGQ